MPGEGGGDWWVGELLVCYKLYSDDNDNDKHGGSLLMLDLLVSVDLRVFRFVVSHFLTDPLRMLDRSESCLKARQQELLPSRESCHVCRAS
ncbi:hypothetical protein NC653_039305 [Populus alba x Populus x berolinensis]|uniref:Uncharacterized protein n=1 Tax=Populus alba x Populus x berolinensis TaxID=444605 RepID=A0AAD6PRY6_9ROSI|nr:hypothetical protein NC653_039305 [Populus alba x Populus x berolinensis]